MGTVNQPGVYRNGPGRATDDDVPLQRCDAAATETCRPNRLDGQMAAEYVEIGGRLPRFEPPTDTVH